MIENVDYELVPADNDHWHIRIKEGDYIETVISFGQIKVDEQQGVMTFNFTIHYTPVPDVTPEDPELQKVAAKILESVIVSNLEDNNSKR